MKSITLILILLTSLLSHGQRFGRPERPERPVPPGRHDRLVNVSLGQVRTNKLISETQTFYPQNWGDRIFRLELVVTKGTVEIESVIVVYENGYIEEMPELRNQLRQGRKISTRIHPDYVREIRVVATSGLIGSRGQYELIAGVLR